MCTSVLPHSERYVVGVVKTVFVIWLTGECMYGLKRGVSNTSSRCCNLTYKAQAPHVSSVQCFRLKNKSWELFCLATQQPSSVLDFTLIEGGTDCGYLWCVLAHCTAEILTHFLYFKLRPYSYVCTGCARENMPFLRRMFVVLNYFDITLNTCIQSWTVTQIKFKKIRASYIFVYLFITKYLWKHLYITPD